jgi:plasmid stabilization system protein ParE
VNSTTPSFPTSDHSRSPASPDYLIFYRYDDPDVQILRVIHGARDIERALEE